MSKLTEKQILALRGKADIIVECLPEDMQIEGNCSAIDPETDRATEEHIRAELENGNEWAWCCVKVTLKYGGFEGTDYLGGCSYKSKADFIESDGYFADMVSQAFDELVAQINEAQETIANI